jgi:peptide-methionine (R)-S-oxide reductase
MRREELEMKHDVTPEVQKTEQEWKAQLDPQRYHILREAGTEAPFSGALLQMKDDGSYVCGACGQRLFTADAKFDSHCGWPSFMHPEQQENVRLLDDNSLGMRRIEVRCKRCDSHLGHVFDDGPGPAGTRYCINSASLDFQPSRRA